MLVIQYPIIRLSVFFVLGICCGRYLSLPVSIYAIVGGVFLGLSIIFFLKKTNSGIQSCVLYGLLLVIGAGVWEAQVPQNLPSHYTNHYKLSDKIACSGIVLETLRENMSSHRYLIRLERLDSVFVSGKVLLSVKKSNKHLLSLNEGDKVVFYSELKSLKGPLHPSQFDYADYMANKGVFHQSWVHSDNLLVTGGASSWLSQRRKIKRNLVSRLYVLGFSELQIDVIKALFLGDKHQMDTELKEQYINSGAVHVLAISGLHIGIVMLFLQFVFRPIELFRNGKTVSTIAVIICLWVLAYFTGLSPSVVRAVTMFSFLSIAIQSGRIHNMYNALFGSLFVLLIVHPQFLFEVGFQMSYVAVFSILLIQPLFKKVFYSKYKIVQYLYDMVSVSLAAQVGLLPISLYYFHHFSGLFLIGNVLVLPVLSILLCTGIPILIFLYFVELSFLVKSLQVMLDWLNEVTRFLSSYSDWIFTEIYFSKELLVVSYLVLLSVLIFVYQKELKWLLMALGVLLLGQINMLYCHAESKSDAFVFHQYKRTLLMSNDSGCITSFGEDSLSTKVATQFRASVFKQKALKKPIANFLILNQKKVMLLGKSGVYLSGVKPDIVLLTKSSKVNLERLINDTQPEKIIADGSNFPSVIDRWRVTCHQKNIPFRTTAEKGYCMIE